MCKGNTYLLLDIAAQPSAEPSQYFDIFSCVETSAACCLASIEHDAAVYTPAAILYLAEAVVCDTVWCNSMWAMLYECD